MDKDNEEMLRLLNEKRRICKPTNRKRRQWIEQTTCECKMVVCGIIIVYYVVYVTTDNIKLMMIA